MMAVNEMYVLLNYPHVFLDNSKLNESVNWYGYLLDEALE